jgi:hypothetical protein
LIPSDLFVTPVSGSVGVSPRVVAVVEFNEPMLGSSITGSTFTLKSGANTISATVAYNPVTWAATLTPTSVLRNNTTYTVQLTTGVTNAQSVALAAPITWTFTTAQPVPSPSRLWYPGLSPLQRRY